MAEEITNNEFDALADNTDFYGTDPIGMDLNNPQLTPLVPNSVPKAFENNTYNIQRDVGGIPPNYTPSKVKENRSNPNLSEDWGKSLMDASLAQLNTYEEKDEYARMYTFDSSPKGTFKARYKAYGQDTYNRIGFDPLMDNESWYNQNTSFGDDISRTMRTSALPMFGLGFMSPLHSYGNMLQGKSPFAQDPQEAEEYDFYNQLSYSSKGGVGGFTNNLVLSAAYSMGILAEGATEGALIGGAVGFAAGEGVGAIPGAMIGGATGTLKQLWRLPGSLMKSYKAMGAMAKSLKSFSNIGKARQLFSRAGRNIGNFANPLSNTLEAVKTGNNLQGLARAATTAGALWHDIKNINMGIAEGRLEGGFTQNQTYDELYNEYYNNYGVAPSDELQEQFMNQAKAAGWRNSLNNAMLVFYSNKIAFPSITRAGFLKGLPKLNAGTVVGRVGKEYQIVFNPAKKAADATYTAERIGFRNALKAVTKPKVWGNTAINYFKANLVEGFQESAQDILNDATKEYYKHTFYDQSARNYRYVTGVLGDAFGKQISAQGAETFASGFLMGTILQLPGKLRNGLNMGYNRFYKNRSNWDQHIKEREASANEVVNSLNTMYNDAKHFYDPRISNYSTQMLVGKMADNDEATTKEQRDAAFSGFMSAVTTSLSNGTFDLFVDNLSSYKEATPEELEEAWNLEKGQGRIALDNIDKQIESAKQMSKRYNEAKAKMKNLINLDELEKGSPEFEKAKIYNEAYRLGLSNLIFLQGSFDNNLERVKKLAGKLSTLDAIKDLNFSNFTNLTDPERLSQEIAMLNTEIESLKANPQREFQADIQSEISRKEAVLEALNNYQTGQNGLIEAYIQNNLVKNLTSEMMSKDPSLSENDAEIKVLNDLVKEYEEGKSNQFLDYKESFSNLLLTLASTQDKKNVLQAQLDGMGGIDTLFDDLLDLHILNNEAAGLTKYINLLSNPRDFYEHVDRNFKWMNDLYSNKKEYIKEIVNQEIENVEKNAILNELADRGIFVDLNQFADWVENNNNLPDFFIDITNERIINKDSVLYTEYIDIFEAASELFENKPAGEPLNEQEGLEARIEELNKERQSKLDQELLKLDETLQENYNKTRKEILNQATEVDEEYEQKLLDKKEKEDQKKFYQKALTQIKLKDPLKIEAIYQLALDSNIITEEDFQNSVDEIINLEDYREDPIKYESLKKSLKEVRKVAKTIDVSRIEDQEEANIIKSSAAFQQVILGNILQSEINTLKNEIANFGEIEKSEFQKLEELPEYKVYEDNIAQINEKYDAEINELKNKIKELEPISQTEDFYTTSTPFENFDNASQDKITTLFDEYLVEDLNENIDIKETDPEQYRKLRERWLERQVDLIDTLNNEVVEARRLRAEELSKPPQLKFLDFKADTKTSTEVLGNIFERLQNILEAGEYAKNPKKPNDKTQLTSEDIENINEDLEAISGYLESRAQLYSPQNIAEEVVDRIVDTIINRRDEVVEILDDEGNTIGRKFADKEDTDASPIRVTQVAEEIKQTLTGVPQFTWSPLEKTEEGNAGPIEAVYNSFFQDPDISNEEAVDLFINRFKELAYSRYSKTFGNEKKLKAFEDAVRQDSSWSNVDSILKKLVFKHYSDAGTNADALIRMYLTPKVSESGFVDFNYESSVEIKGNEINVSDIMSKDAYDTLFHPATGIISKLRQGIIDGKWTILSENVLLFDKTLRENGITGEIDLLAVNEKGEVKIIDIKTGNPGTWKTYGTGAEFDKETYFRAQQSIYANLFYNMSGLDVDSIGLLPLETQISLDGYIESVKKPALVPKGQDTIEIEKLDEISQFGMERIEPNFKEIQKETDQEATRKEKIEIPQSDPTKLTLEENEGSVITYNGRTGILSKMPNGGYGILITTKKDDTLLEVTLESLNNELVLEKASEFKNEDVITELEKNIRDLENKRVKIDDIKELFPIKFNMENIFDGTLNMMDVGIQPVAVIDNVGQQRLIGSKIINAKFDNPQETIATINGVKYDVMRDASGNITLLSYMSNEKEIKDIDKEAGAISFEISDLRKKALELNDLDKDIELRKISKKQAYKKALDLKRSSLVDSNKRIYLNGSNSEDLIFALNKLPNSFQKVAEGRTKSDEIIDIKDIGRLSLSESVAESITEIMSKNYPDSLDTLLEKGLTNDVNGQQIIDWARETIEQLDELGYSVINRGDLVDDISRQIDALNLLLGDLELINLNKDGKISKRQKGEVRDYFERQKIQEGASVVKDAESTRPETKRVSRPSTKTELKRKVDSVRKKGQQLDIQFLEDLDSSDNTFIQAINEANKTNLEDVYDDALLEASKEGSKLNLDDVKLAYEIKLNELETSMEISNLEKGEYLLNKDDNNKIYLVKKINKKSVSLEDIETKEKMNASQEDLINNYEKMTDQDVPKTEITEEQEESSKESVANLKELAKNEEELSKAKEEAAKSSREERLKKLKDNSLNC